jgi:hypothetical protein
LTACPIVLILFIWPSFRKSWFRSMMTSLCATSPLSWRRPQLKGKAISPDRRDDARGEKAAGIPDFHDGGRFAAKAVRDRDRLERKLAACMGSIKRMVSALEKGSLPTDVVTARLQELEGERQRLRIEVARAKEAVPVIELHPQAVLRYRADMEKLGASLGAIAEASPEAAERFRRLVGRVVVRPGDPPEVEVSGWITARTGAKSEVV